MFHYIVKNTPDTPNSEGIEVSEADIVRHMDELSGRPGIGAYCRGQLRKRGPRVFVACARGSHGRTIYGAGFIVEQVTT